MICKICNYRDTNGRSSCKVCDYKKRHNENIQKILNDGFWSSEEIDLILDKILYKRIDVINDLLLFFNGKTMFDLVELLRGDLRIGNVQQLVKMNCYTCGKPVLRTLVHFYDERVYCNFECRDKYRSKYLSGENSPFYKRETIACTNCGKPMDIIPSNYNKTNEFGDSNHFCSKECYWEYRSKYYVGEKHPQYGIELTEERKNKSREVALNNIKNGKVPQTLTNPHKKIRQLLIDNKIQFEDEYICKYHSIDIYVQEYNLMIEIMGDYWHGSPLKYSYNDLNKYQLKDIKQDKSKHTYIKKYYGNEILYLWETDINKNLDLCYSLIFLYISQNGILENYHSFNYHMEDGQIKLNNDIIHPYFDNTESLETAG